MIRAFRGSKRTWWALGSLAVSLVGCTPFRRPVPAELLPRRVVLALDGLDYRDVLEARTRGRFAGFHEPARLASTFPSISDIAWHAIFGVQPPAGYQRVFFSTRHNAVLGDALSAIRPIEYEERMDYAFDAKFHHLGAYLISWPVARAEVDADVEHILRSRGRETVYLYNVGPDALQHTRGDIARYLDHLSDQLDSLQARYQARSGRRLEIVVLSDHGHNRGRDAAFIPLTEALAAKGFHTARSIGAPNQIAFSVDGVTTGFGVFCAPDSVLRVAAVLADVPGVELVTARLSANTYTVLATDSAGRTLRARIEQRALAGDEPRERWYRYTPEAGDPLALQPVIARMAAAGLVDANGFAAESTWVRETVHTRYPVAVPRIVYGHTAATRNPAPILVSVTDAHRVGLGAVSVANRMRPLGGTHGALGETNALGVILSNGVVPRDDVAWRVRWQFGGFDDLQEPHLSTGAVQVVFSDDLRDDRFARRAWPDWQRIPPGAALVLLAVPPRALQGELPAPWVRFEVRLRDRSTPEGRLVRSTALPVASAWRSGTHPELAWRATDAGLTDLVANGDYVVRVLVEYRRDARDGFTIERTQTLSTTVMRAAPDGTLWSY